MRITSVETGSSLEATPLQTDQIQQNGAQYRPLQTDIAQQNGVQFTASADDASGALSPLSS